MNTIKYITGCLMILLLQTACTSESLMDGVSSEDNRIKLVGSVAREVSAGEVSSKYTNLKLMAELGNNAGGASDDKNGEVYISEVAIDAVALSGSSTAITFGTNPVYYPLNQRNLNFFAYSGKAIDKGTNIDLTAGQGLGNDALLSNNGGKGTEGNSKSPSTELVFRHVMTKLDVEVLVDNTETPDKVDPLPKSVNIEIDGVTEKGKFPVKADINAKAAAVGIKKYTIKLGTNYLVSTGNELTNMSNLVIDDYEATDDDLKSFTINKISGTSDKLLLNPGQAYTLTFTVKRLKVTGITFTKTDWITKELTQDSVLYEPKKLKLDLGDYDKEGAVLASDTITKIVLYDADKQYVGKMIDKVGYFVVLPTGSVTKFDLYTSKGLLVSNSNSSSYTYNASGESSLTLSLSKGGMLPVDPVNGYSANNPYAVTTPVQLMNISKDLGAHYRQTGTLDMNTNQAVNSIGAFTGSYDGNGKSILFINLAGKGLFSSNAGTLKNIRLTRGTIAGDGGDVGAICGSNAGMIIACTNEAQIIGTATNAGGICGSNSGTIVGCINTGNITTGSIVGGICGTNSNTTAGAIKACVNVGMLNINATSLAGICGTSTANAGGVLKVCYWLTGTAEKKVGADEVGVNGYTVDVADDIADLSPDKLRDGHNAEEVGEAQKTVARLNAAFASSDYNFLLNQKTTGSTWPIPYKEVK